MEIKRCHTQHFPFPSLIARVIQHGTSISPPKQSSPHFGTKRCLLLCNFCWKKPVDCDPLNPLVSRSQSFQSKQIYNHKAQVSVFCFSTGNSFPWSSTTNNWKLYWVVSIPKKSLLTRYLFLIQVDSLYFFKKMKLKSPPSLPFQSSSKKTWQMKYNFTKLYRFP